jgi:hypothetical protein
MSTLTIDTAVEQLNTTINKLSYNIVSFQKHEITHETIRAQYTVCFGFGQDLLLDIVFPKLEDPFLSINAGYSPDAGTNYKLSIWEGLNSYNVRSLACENDDYPNLMNADGNWDYEIEDKIVTLIFDFLDKFENFK